MDYTIIKKQIYWLKDQIKCLSQELSRIQVIDQNNLVSEYFVPGINESLVSISMNVLGNLVVEEREIYIINHTYSNLVVEIGLAPTYQLVYKSYLFKAGKGEYGALSGVTLTEDDFFLLNETTTNPIPTVEGKDPVVKTIFTNDIDINPDILVNSSNETYEIAASQDYYFVIQSLSKLFPRPSKIYRYVGPAGTFGQGGTTTQLGDYILVAETEGVTFQQDNSNNFSRTIKVTSEDLVGVAGATLDDQIINYINSLNYIKQSSDADIWIDYEDTSGIFTSEFTNEFQ